MEDNNKLQGIEKTIENTQTVLNNLLKNNRLVQAKLKQNELDELIKIKKSFIQLSSENTNENRLLKKSTNFTEASVNVSLLYFENLQNI